jgi:hypothetical protein
MKKNIIAGLSMMALMLALAPNAKAQAENNNSRAWNYEYTDVRENRSNVIQVPRPAAPQVASPMMPSVMNAGEGAPPPGPPSRRQSAYYQNRLTTGQGQYIRGRNDASGAWARQWGPIQDVTGVSAGTAQHFIQDVKTQFVQDNQKVLSSAQDWATIAGSSGLVGVATDSSSDWFKYVTTDIPAAFTQNGSSAPVSAGFIGGSGGFGSFPGYGGHGEGAE